MPDITFRDALTNAFRFWERLRIVYNLVLTVIVVAVYFVHIPPITDKNLFNDVQTLFVLAVLANIAFCAAYLADVPAQLSGFRSTWLRLRWVLFAIGLVFASILARAFSLGMFGVN